MLKSIAVVLGSYLLSIVLVFATNPLLSLIFPGEFAKDDVPSNPALMASTAFFVVVSILCAWLCARFAPSPRRAPRALVLHSRRSHGHRRNHPQLEQALAPLVLDILAAHLASKLLDRPPPRQTPRRLAVHLSNCPCGAAGCVLLDSQPEISSMRIADLILPVFAVIVTGWVVGYTRYLSRTLSDALIHFAYILAMRALVIVSFAQEPRHSLIIWRFLAAFGGGLPPLLRPRIRHHEHSCFPRSRQPNDAWHGGVHDQYRIRLPLPVLQAIYGPRAVLPAAIATVFVAVVMFPFSR